MRTFPELSIVTCAIEPECTSYIFPFLKSVSRSDYPKNRIEIIIQDNGLTNKTRLKILKSDLRIKINGKGQNFNFAKGINEAVKKTKGEFVFITNVDTIVELQMFNNLIQVMQNHPDIGIAGPRVFSLEHREKISNRDLPIISYNRFTGGMKGLTTQQILKLNKNTSVTWISGCGFLVRRKLWQKLGGFDEKYIAYWEDADFALRIKNIGLDVVVVPQAIMWHSGSVVYGDDSPNKTYRMVKSYLYFTSKHTSFLCSIFTAGRAIIICLFKSVKLLLGIGRKTQIAYLRAVFDHYLSYIIIYE